MDITHILTDIVSKNASDIFIVAGRALSIKVNNVILNEDATPLTPEMTENLISAIYRLANGRSMESVLREGDDDFSFAIKDVSRFRASVYKQRGSLSAVIRVIKFVLPDPEKIHIPQAVMRLTDYHKGLVLVTGPSGSGKSTTLACIIDKINSTRNGHIITLEEPIEFLHPHKNSIVSQREIALDTDNYLTALRAALRQTPDVILIGELRDPETISIAMTAAETGHLVISTLHTLGAANTIDRIIDVFPPQKQSQIRLQLSMVLQAVVSQQLILSHEGTLIPAFEVMTATTAIKTMIREAKTHQIGSVIQSSAQEGMVSMDNALLELAKTNLIDTDTALSYCENPDSLAKKLHILGGNPHA